MPIIVCRKRKLAIISSCLATVWPKYGDPLKIEQTTQKGRWSSTRHKLFVSVHK